MVLLQVLKKHDPRAPGSVINTSLYVVYVVYVVHLFYPKEYLQFYKSVSS